MKISQGAATAVVLATTVTTSAFVVPSSSISNKASFSPLANSGLSSSSLNKRNDLFSSSFTSKRCSSLNMVASQELIENDEIVFKQLRKRTKEVSKMKKFRYGWLSSLPENNFLFVFMNGLGFLEY